MRRNLAPALAVVAVALFVFASVALARPYESFTLEAGDRIVAETPGCFANCAQQGSRRTCTVKDFDCKAVCTPIPECKPDGLHAIKVCAVIRESK